MKNVMVLTEKVNFLCSGSPYIAFWIFDENSGDSTPMFLVTALQCLHGAKDFSAFNTAPPARRLRVHRELGGDRTRADQTDQRYPISFDIMLSNKYGVEKEEGEDIQTDGICLPKKSLLSFLSLLHLWSMCVTPDKQTCVT